VVSARGERARGAWRGGHPPPLDPFPPMIGTDGPPSGKWKPPDIFWIFPRYFFKFLCLEFWAFFREIRPLVALYSLFFFFTKMANKKVAQKKKKIYSV